MTPKASMQGPLPFGLPCLPACLPPLPACLLASPACLPACLPCLPARLPPLPACLPASPACLPACLPCCCSQEGPRAFYRGWLPSVIGVVPYVGLNFAVYESLKAELLILYGEWQARLGRGGGGGVSSGLAGGR